MALATICPHCNTTFRVAADQLKLRGGIVRCGACNEVFDGNAALVELTAAAHPADAAAAQERSPQQAPVQQAPIYTLDFDTTFDPFGIRPASPPPAPEPEPEPAPPATGPAPVSIQPADEEIPAGPVLDDTFEQSAEAPAPASDPLPAREASVDFQPPLLMRASASTASALAPTQASPSVPTPPVDAAAKSVRRNVAKKRKALPVAAPVVAAIAPEPEPGEHEPEFVKISRRRERTGRSRSLVLGAGAVVLVLVLAAQGVVTFRNVLAARYPQANALLGGACAVLGCKVELPAHIDALSVETGELQSLGANTFSLTTLLRNQASLVQAWPHLELALTDANDKPLVRRVFTPAEYLPQGVAPAKGIAPRSEQAVKLAFELNQVKASGYHIAIFYP